MTGPDDPDSPVEIPITDVLDLHAFAPRDIPSVVEEYIRAAHEAGMREVRLIHGRGRGIQRGIVQKVPGKPPSSQRVLGLSRVASWGHGGTTARRRARCRNIMRDYVTPCHDVVRAGAHSARRCRTPRAKWCIRRSARSLPFIGRSQSAGSRSSDVDSPAARHHGAPPSG